MAETQNPIRRFPLQTGVWVPIVAPMRCNYYSLSNADGSAMLLGSDTTNPDAEFELNAGMWHTVTAPAPTEFRYHAGETVIYAMALAGTGPAIAQFFE